MIWKRLHLTRASRPTPFLGIFLVSDYLHFVAVVIVIIISPITYLFPYYDKRPVSSLMRETFGGHFAFYYSTEFGIFCRYQQGNSTKEPIVDCTFHIPVEARIQFLLERISHLA
jgi:hypothetical protein